jgi:hypothetical protein
VLRTLSAEKFNIIANDPEVRPWLGIPGEATAPVDLSAIVGNPDNFCFLTQEQDGGYVLIKHGPGQYVAHTLSLPPARGRPMLKTMRDGFATMFMATDAMEIVTMIPDGNAAADKWAGIAGFREMFRRELFFPLMGEMVGGSFRSLLYADWAAREKNNVVLGELVHERMHGAGVAVSHAPDRVHDAWVGATMGCAIEGNATKGVVLYNRYAAQAGYAPLKLIGTNPPLVDTGQCIIQLVSGRFDILIRP